MILPPKSAAPPSSTAPFESPIPEELPPLVGSPPPPSSGKPRLPALIPTAILQHPERLKTLESAIQKILKSIRILNPARAAIIQERGRTFHRRAETFRSILLPREDKLPDSKDILQAFEALKGPTTPALIEITSLPVFTDEELSVLAAHAAGVVPFLGIEDANAIAVRALHGLVKIIKAEKLPEGYKMEVPTYSEMEAWAILFGPDVRREVLRKTGTAAVLSFFEDLINLPRILLAGLGDMSAVGNTGFYALATSPKTVLKGIRNSFKAFIPFKGKGEEFVRKLESDLTGRPNYELYHRSGLELVSASEPEFAYDEWFPTQLPYRIPIIRDLLHASRRAFHTHLNTLRVDLFDRIANELIHAGYTFETHPELFRSLASVLNKLTGRGALPGSDPQAKRVYARILNLFLFAPRFLLAQLELIPAILKASYLGAAKTGHLDNTLTKFAAGILLKNVATALTLLGLAEAMGATVGWDPRSTDFGKVVIGNTHINLLGPLQSWIRFFAQLLTGERYDILARTIRRTGTQGSERFNMLLNFLLSKTSPVIQWSTSEIKGRVYGGDPITLEKRLQSFFLPIWVQDVWEAVQDELRYPQSKEFWKEVQQHWQNRLPPTVLRTFPLAWFGFGITTYPHQNEQALSYPPGGRANPILQTLNELGYELAPHPVQFIIGKTKFKVPDDQVGPYRLYVGRVVYQFLVQTIANGDPKVPVLKEEFRKKRTAQKRAIIDQILKRARQVARQIWWYYHRELTEIQDEKQRAEAAKRLDQKMRQRLAKTRYSNLPLPTDVTHIFKKFVYNPPESLPLREIEKERWKQRKVPSPFLFQEEEQQEEEE